MSTFNLSLTQLEYLLAVDRYRHFGRAAEACFVTQPTLSMQLKALEDTLGGTLFDRSKKPILPTEMGKRVIEQARRVMDEAKKLPILAQSEKMDLQGDFHLAVIPTLAPYLLPLFLSQLSAAAPKVNFRIEELQTHQILAALEHDEIDCGLLVTPLKDPRIQELPLFYEPFYLYVSKEHPLSKRERIQEDQLDGKDLWLLQEGHCFRSQAIRLCSKSPQSERLKNVKFESGNLETLMRLVDRNGGYTLIPHLAQIQKTARAEVKSFQKPVPSREVSLVFRRAQLKMPIIEKLSEVIRSVIPEELKSLKKKELEIVQI